MISINITVDGIGSVDAEFAKLGFVRHSLVEKLLAGVAIPNAEPEAHEAANEEVNIDRTPNPNWKNTSVDEQKGEAAAPQRERGKPAPGRGRRTKEEIAADEAADRADAALAAADKPQISTGEERVGPEDAAALAQDAEDERVETEAIRAENGGKLTLDDLRSVIGAYQRTYGMAAVTADVPALLGKKMIEVTEDELPSAIETMQSALDDNPLGRPRVDKPAAEPQQAAAPTPQPEATKADVVAALMRYALRYDGQNTDQTNMPNTMEDGKFVLQKLFGDAVTSAGKIPASGENYAKAVAGIEEMIARNPFKRDVKVA